MKSLWLSNPFMEEPWSLSATAQSKYQADFEPLVPVLKQLNLGILRL